MSNEQIFGIVRTVLAAASGFFVAKGVIDAETAAAVTGAMVTIFVAVWSVKSKKKADPA